METLVPLLVFGLVGAVLIAITANGDAKTRRFLLRTMGIALAARFLLALLFALVPGTRLFHEDASGYEWLGTLLAKHWWGQGPNLPIFDGRPNTGYIYFVGALNFVIGPYPIVGALANAIIGALTVNVVYRISSDLFQPLVARRAAQLVAYFPSMILWSSIAIKDPLVSLLIAMSLWGCLRLKRRLGVRPFLLTAIPILCIQPVRYYVVYFVVFAVVAGLGLERGLRSLSGVYKQLAVVALIALLATVAGLSSGLQRGLDDASLVKISTFRRGMATTAQSGFSHDVDVSTPTSAILFLPVGVATLLFAPFPWQFTSLRAILSAPEMLLWWSLVPALLRGLRFTIRERWREASPLLLFSCSLTVAYSLIEGNVGAAFRQRSQIFVFLFIFAALGHYVGKARRIRIPVEALLRDGGDAAPRSPEPASP
jgi:hypothetical protein